MTTLLWHKIKCNKILTITNCFNFIIQISLFVWNVCDNRWVVALFNIMVVIVMCYFYISGPKFKLLYMGGYYEFDSFVTIKGSELVEAFNPNIKRPLLRFSNSFLSNSCITDGHFACRVNTDGKASKYVFTLSKEEKQYVANCVRNN